MKQNWDTLMTLRMYIGNTNRESLIKNGNAHIYLRQKWDPTAKTTLQIHEAKVRSSRNGKTGIMELELVP